MKRPPEVEAACKRAEACARNLHDDHTTTAGEDRCALASYAALLEQELAGQITAHSSWKHDALEALSRAEKAEAALARQKRRHGTYVAAYSQETDAKRLRDALAELGNLLGGPTAGYVPEYENKERGRRINQAVALIAKTLKETR